MKWNEQLYHSLAYELKTTYGRQLFRLSLNGGMKCPHRTDTSTGCIFCSAKGSGDFSPSPNLKFEEQFQLAKQQLGPKDQGPPYIAYFQAYTNTFAPLPYLQELYTPVIHHTDVAILSIATRADCLSIETMDYLSQLNQIKPVWVELGLQTIHSKSHQLLKTGFQMESFLSALSYLNKNNISVIVHAILGLPGESHSDIMETIDFIASLPIQGVKLHMLFVQENTELSFLYSNHPFPLYDMEEYASCICDCLERLRPDQVIHRLTGDCPRKELLAPLWTTSKRKTLNRIHQILLERNSYQGKYTRGYKK